MMGGSFGVLLGVLEYLYPQIDAPYFLTCHQGLCCVTFYRSLASLQNPMCFADYDQIGHCSDFSCPMDLLDYPCPMDLLVDFDSFLPSSFLLLRPMGVCPTV